MPTLLEDIQAEISSREPSLQDAIGAELATRQKAESRFPEGTEIIAEVDGGQVYQLPSGQQGFTSPEYSTVDPDQVTKIMEGADPASVSKRGIYEDIIAQAPVAARAGQFVRGAPFVGEYVDEALGAIVGPQVQTGMRAQQSAMEEINPYESMALQVGGGLAIGGPTAAGVMGGPMIMGKAIPPAQKAIMGGGLGAVAGAIEGWISGYGAGEGDDRAQSAADRSKIGAALGLGIGAATPIASYGFNKLFTFIANKPIKAAAKSLGVSEDVVRAMKDTMGADDFQEAIRRLDVGGEGAILADVGPAAAGRLDLTIQKAGGGTAVQSITARAREAGVRLTSTLDDVLGSPDGRLAATRAIRAADVGETPAAYARAYTTPIDYASPEGRAIEELVGRLPSRQLNAAIESANDMLRYHGVDAKQILAEVAEDGTVAMREMPNVAQLDYLKRAFDSIRMSGTDPITGKLTPDANLAGQIATSIRDVTRNAVPAYGEALSLASDVLSQESAVAAGYSLLRAPVTREISRNAVKGMTKPELAAARIGVRNYIDDTLSNVRRTVMDADVDVREVQKTLSDLSTRASRDKLTVLLGKDAASQVFDELDRAAIALNLRAATSANSATFARLAGEASVAESTAPKFWNLLGQMKPKDAVQRLGQVLTGATPEAVKLRQDGLYADMADMLVNIRGDDAKRALIILRNTNITDKMTAGQATFISGLLGEQAGILAQQAATREYAQ